MSLLTYSHTLCWRSSRVTQGKNAKRGQHDCCNAYMAWSTPPSPWTVFFDGIMSSCVAAEHWVLLVHCKLSLYSSVINHISTLFQRSASLPMSDFLPSQLLLCDNLAPSGTLYVSNATTTFVPPSQYLKIGARGHEHMETHVQRLYPSLQTQNAIPNIIDVGNDKVERIMCPMPMLYIHTLIRTHWDSTAISDLVHGTHRK
jgi:hypothetical protein